MKISDEKIQAHNETQRRYYGRELEKKARLVPTGSTYIMRHLQQVIAFGNLTKGERILDVGCGMGKYTLPLAKLQFDVEGLDLSPDLLAYFEAYNQEKLPIPLHCYDILDRPVELKERFDVLVGFFTLHHLVDLTLCLSAMQHYLCPGGRIVFLEPNAFNPLYYIQILTTPGMTWEGDKGMLKMRRSILARSAQQAGLVDFRLKRFGMFPPALTNRRFGPWLEDRVNIIPFLRLFSAFQIVSASKPAFSR